MQEDFHYYATYCAAYLAGYTHEESEDICYCAQLVDLCSGTFLTKLNAPLSAATTQLQLEMMDARTDIIGLQNITRIWASFHFLPYDLYAQKRGRTRIYMNKYRLICMPNSDLMVKTVELAKGKPIQAVGVAMHVLADTWAHSYFAGTPSLAINNTNWNFREVITIEGEEREVPIKFRHNPSAKDDVANNLYTSSIFQNNENSVMNLGHGRAGHLPDYSFMKYRYIPAWDDYKEITKDNPSDYLKAFAQMIYAMKYIRGDISTFGKDKYDTEAIEPYKDRINAIIRKRQLIASEDWKSFGEDLSGKKIRDFDLEIYQKEYITNYKKEDTFLGKFIEAALAQKGMVTYEIYTSKNYLAGFSKTISNGNSLLKTIFG
ncbi:MULTISPECIES: DUF6765 family protein [unclassified Butyrivibrio]|uniref:DUF6765 family protein n=1 Tax=unclassified Butyrivibrio TaxID=2639466 RepID=UPI000426EF25|nr:MULTISPECIES: DUF6765 family protein [unclassified Butyrivibrio]